MAFTRFFSERVHERQNSIDSGASCVTQRQKTSRHMAGLKERLPFSIREVGEIADVRLGDLEKREGEQTVHARAVVRIINHAQEREEIKHGWLEIEAAQRKEMIRDASPLQGGDKGACRVVGAH